MTTVRHLLSVLVKAKGPLHTRLHELLRAAWEAKTITQESLAAAIGNSQENSGQYLRGTRAGTLDLDQADAALRHIGSNLPDFLADLPPRELTPTEQLAQALAARPQLETFVRDLLAVPRPRLSGVLELARTAMEVATGRPGGRSAARRRGRPPATRTTTARGKRR